MRRVTTATGNSNIGSLQRLEARAFLTSQFNNPTPKIGEHTMTAKYAKIATAYSAEAYAAPTRRSTQWQSGNPPGSMCDVVQRL